MQAGSHKTDNNQKTNGGKNNNLLFSASLNYITSGSVRLAARRLGKTAVLVHIDLGTTDVKANARLLADIVPLLAPLVRSGGIIVCNQALSCEGWKKIPEPPGVKPGRYFLYRVD